MCELEPPDPTVPVPFRIGLGYMELSVCIEYLQEDVLWDIIVMDGHPDDH